MKLITEHIRRYFSTTDKLLWLLCLSVSGIGVLLQYGTLHSGYAQLLSITSRNLTVQCTAIGIGVVAAVLLSLINYHTLKKLWFLHVPVTYLLVVLTFFIGVGAAARADDKRWLIIPGIQFWLQPAELLKISFILAFAYQIVHCGEALNRPLNVLLLAVHAGVPIMLIHFQGDDGTALLVATIAATMLVIAGIAVRYIIVTGVSLLALIPVLWRYVVSDFQKQRILILFHQDESANLGQYYQQYRSKAAFAMGGKTGIGLFSENHTYVPEMHTDFIFSFLAESFGLMGALGVLALMTALCLKMLHDASKSKDQYGRLLCVGVFAMVLFQFAINVGMCLSMLPVIGNTFPFLSYGGSSILTNFMGLGLVLSVYGHRNKGLFDNNE